MARKKAVKNAGTDDERKENSVLDEEALFDRLTEHYADDDEHSGPWRKRARENYDFYAGRQWSDDDKAKLVDEKRPIITFNRCIAIIKSVSGLEINSRHDTVFLPRESNQEEVRANEILTAGSNWMADSCDAEDEQSEAFQDTLIVGMGWSEAVVDFELEADGMYVEKKIDPLEMRWDRNARSKNLADAKRLWRVREMPIRDAMDMFPDVDPDDLDASAWASVESGEVGSGKTREQKRKRTTGDSSYQETPKGMVTIVHAQWIEKETYHRVAHPKYEVHPVTGQGVIVGYEELSLSVDEFKAYKEESDAKGIKFDSVKQKRPVYKQAYLGAKILSGVMDGPCGNAFSWNCITGERDPNKGTWFGLIEIMRDPQMWANKWLAQTLHILNTSAKGGILAEKGAFPDIREAQKTYAKADAITETADGAITKGRIMQKPGTGIAGPYVQLMEFAMAAIRDVPGINLEQLGLADRNQPGILEHQRKQAGMTILATLFDSLRRFRKRVGRVRLHYLQEYFCDGRIIRVAGPDGKKFMPLLKDKMTGKYDVEVDDAPTSPNQREMNWAIIQQLFPVFKDLMTPEATIVLLEFSPLPAQVIEAFKQMLAKPDPEKEERQELMKQGEITKIKSVAATTEKDKAAALKQRASAILDMASAFAKGQEAELTKAQTSKTEREITMDDIVNEIRKLVAGGDGDAVLDPSSGLPLPPELPSGPARPNGSIADLIDPAAMPIQVQQTQTIVDEFGTPIG